MFCEKCGCLLIPKLNKGKRSFFCRKCNKYSSFNKKMVEKGENKSKIVLIREKRVPLPKIEAECRKCGNKMAYFWIEQTRASDEPPTRFFRCTKCGKTWREY